MSYLNGPLLLDTATVSNHVRENLVSLFDYDLAAAGNFISVYLPSDNGVTLRAVSHPNYIDGQIWESPRKNWVWESGIGALVEEVDGSKPGVTGVYVDGTFYGIDTTGTYAHIIDHTLGRVIFNSAIDTDSVVKCQYSYKYVNVTSVDGLSWQHDVQKTKSISNTGEYELLSEYRFQLPAIGIEVISRDDKGLQLGGGKTVTHQVLFHCVAEDAYTCEQLSDIIVNQKHKTFSTFDVNAIFINNAQPLSITGSPNSGALRYPDLIDAHPGRRIYITDATKPSKYNISQDIHVTTVRVTAESTLFTV